MKTFNETQKFEDDGHTIANMNVEGMPWYKPYKKEQGSSEALSLTWTEKRAMFFGIMSELIPLVGIIVVVFTLVYLVLDLFWLR